MARSLLLSIRLVLGVATLAACGDDDRGGGGGGTDSGPIRDGGRQPDGGPLPDEDAGPLPGDAGPTEDTGPAADSGPATDGGPTADAGPTCPENDLGSATGDAVAMGDTTGAGDDLPAECADPGGEDVTYRWTAPSDGSFIFDTNGSASDTTLHLHNDTCTGTVIVCDDDGGVDTQSRAVATMTAGQVVVIVVDSFDGFSAGAWVLNINAGPATETGACSGAVDDDRDGDVDCDDSDCTADVACIAAGAPTAAGDLVITEIMNDPMAISDTNGEYFELYNPTTSTFDLNGCTIRDFGTSMHVITGSVMVAPGARVALASSAMAGFTPAYAYMGVGFNNSMTDGVRLECGGPSVLIDEVSYTYGVWPNGTGFSIQLSPTAAQTAVANDLVANWCPTPAGTTFGTGSVMDRGTPGAANVPCM